MPIECRLHSLDNEKSFDASDDGESLDVEHAHAEKPSSSAAAIDSRRYALVQKSIGKEKERS